MEDLEEVVVQRHFRLRVDPSRDRNPVLEGLRIFLARKKRLDRGEVLERFGGERVRNPRRKP